MNVLLNLVLSLFFAVFFWGLLDMAWELVNIRKGNEWVWVAWFTPWEQEASLLSIHYNRREAIQACKNHTGLKEFSHCRTFDSIYDFWDLWNEEGNYRVKRVRLHK